MIKYSRLLDTDKNIWRDGLPWDDDNDLHGITLSTYGIRSFTDGRMHFVVDPFKVDSGSRNVCPWLLNLENGVLNEIDVVEFMNNKMYFSIYWNNKSSEYFDADRKRLYKRFQVKLRRKIKDIAVYSIDWNKDRVKWYINNKPVAICYHLPITEELFLITSGLDRGIILSYIEKEKL